MCGVGLRKFRVFSLWLIRDQTRTFPRANAMTCFALFGTCWKVQNVHEILTNSPLRESVTIEHSRGTCARMIG